jgi:hypothetical protein
MPKQVRRFVGRTWSAWEHARAELAMSDGPYCERCGDVLVWRPYEKRLVCPTILRFEKEDEEGHGKPV